MKKCLEILYCTKLVYIAVNMLPFCMQPSFKNQNFLHIGGGQPPPPLPLEAFRRHGVPSVIQNKNMVTLLRDDVAMHEVTLKLCRDQNWHSKCRKEKKKKMQKN